MGNRIYTGPADRQPKTISDRTCAAALLPGTFVSVLVGTVAQATAPTAVRLALLGERDGELIGGDQSLLHQQLAGATADGERRTARGDTRHGHRRPAGDNSRPHGAPRHQQARRR